MGTLATGVGAVAASSTHAAKACETSKHVLTLVKKGKCAKGSSAVTLGAAGPRGKQGKPGIQGKQGLSQAYSSTILGTSGNYLTGSYANLVSSDVPAGNYIINWEVAMSNDAATAGSFQCGLKVGAATADILDNNIGPDVSGTVGRASLAGTFGLKIPAATTVALECESTSGSDIRPGAGESQTLTLVQVDTLL